MKKLRLFSTKVAKRIEGDEAELYVNFYLVLNRTYGFTFLIDAPNLSCTDRHPIKLWKDFLIMLEEENVKYMRRYETGEDTATKKEKECTDCKWYGFTCECPVHCTQDTKIAWESVTKGEGKRW